MVLTGGSFMKQKGELMDKSEHYWKTKITELEMRIESLETDLAILKKTDVRNDFYTIEEYADLMKVCKATVYHRVKNGYITAVKIGKSWRIPKSQLFEIK